jgi:serine/threonine-protein kinase PpkA
VIEIPGYRIARPLGRGGMSTVYLALQESVQREVALKIMAGTLLGDEEFGERFLREARIAASLRHPGVVHIYDVGQHDEHHYIAMEHLPGGPVLTRRGPRRDYAFAVRVVREIAAALDYAHRRGVVHRDIKPDNILLREDDSAVLTDFGIARASDSMRMTRTGAIIGTPHYMSPEQARGQALDGRADLYSLGVVFHEMLLGQVPYRAEDSVAVGIMHITAPLPKLPESLAVLQPMFDRLLAKEPGDRYQSGAELAEALQAIEHLGLELPEPLPRGRSRSATAAPDTPTVVTPPGPEALQASESFGRSGPRLGAMEGVVADEARPRRAVRSGRASRRSRASLWWAGAAVVLALAVSAAWLYGPALLPQWQGSDRAEQLLRAEQALQSGRLRDDADGPGARSLFNAILAAEPDHEGAREGLRRVGRAHLDAAQRHAVAGDAALARSELEAARALGVAAGELETVQAQIGARQDRDARLEQIAELLESARMARRAGRIEESGTGAVALYQQVLAMDPDNALARSELREALAPLLAQANASMDAGDLAAADAALASVAQADPAHLDLPDARARLAQLRKARSEEIAALLSEARRRSARGDFATPIGASARDALQAILTLEPEHAEAKEGLRQLGQQLLQRADAAAADFDFERAEAALDAAALLSPPPGGLRSARTRLEEARERYGRLPKAGSADPQRLAALVAEAQTAISEGRLLHPPGESAFDSLRAALQLDPSHAQAKSLMQALPAQARARFEAALSASQPNRALRYLEGLQVVAPTDVALPAMRERLAAAYSGLADERLGRGELRGARQALERVAELAPNHTSLPALRARLEQAGG